jgi:hypothetical protein
MGEARAGSGRWIHHWDPEDREFRKREGSRVARRNLVPSIATEHLGIALAVRVIQRPDAPLWVFLAAGATAGPGGGNLARRPEVSHV